MEREKATDFLIEQAQVAERPFTSQTPILGPLIVWLRTAWLNMAERAYIRPLRQQQNQFNRHLLAQLARHDEWLIHQDHALTQNRRALGSVTQQLRQIHRETNSE